MAVTRVGKCYSSRASGSIKADVPIMLDTKDGNLGRTKQVTAYTDDFIGFSQDFAVDGQNYPWTNDGILKGYSASTFNAGDTLALDQVNPLLLKAVTVVTEATVGAVRVKTVGKALDDATVINQAVSFIYTGNYEYVVPA